MVANIVSVSMTNLSLMTKDVADAREVKSIENANKALGRLLNNSEYVDTLIKNSTRWSPPPSIRVLSTLWGLMDPDEKPQLSKKMIEQAVMDEGGSYTESDALWEQLKPKTGTSETVDPGDFVKNPYLVKALTLVYEPIHEALNETRIKSAMINSAPTTGSLFDFYKGGGSGSVLDLAV